MDRFWRYKLDHWIFWITTVFFHVFTRTQLLDSAGVFPFITEIVVRNVLLAALIYGNLLVLVPRYFQRGGYVLYVLFLVFMLAGYVLLKDAHDVYLYGYLLDNPARQGIFSNALYNFSIALFYLMFSVALHLSKEWYFQRLLIRRIEIEKLNTELEYLKAQINPHFLFNSINTIYFQIDKSNATARDTLSRFSAMLRYQLYECNGEKIAVEKEIEYLTNYIALQQARTDDNYRITFTSEVTESFSLSPLLLIPFVENAFKHVSHAPKELNEITVALSHQQGVFHMRVFNTREMVAGNGTDRVGIGLKNVMRRLELLYNGNHKLDIQETDHTFEVNLQLKVS